MTNDLLSEEQQREPYTLKRGAVFPERQGSIVLPKREESPEDKLLRLNTL